MSDTQINIRPLWTNSLGCFHIYICNDANHAIIHEIAEKIAFTLHISEHEKNNESRIWTDNSFVLKKVLEVLCSITNNWHIEYEEYGEDLDKHCAATFNKHTFTTKKEVLAFCKSYFDKASLKHEFTWSRWRMGEIPFPMKSDGTLLMPENCEECQNCAIVSVKHKIKKGIESYTPIYGCKYRGKKCNPLDYPPEDK